MTKLKRLLITLSVVVLMLTVTVLPQAHAYDGNGAEADYSSPTGTWVDGVSYVRTGFSNLHNVYRLCRHFVDGVLSSLILLGSSGVNHVRSPSRALKKQ